MIQKIDKFFVIDFDRCIGNIDESFNILMEVAHELSIVDRLIFKSMREKTESSGGSFSALEYIKDYYPSVDLDVIEKMYLERALEEPSILLKPGAIDFIFFLHSTNSKFCIMSFGDKRWQTIKIIGAGINNVPVIIVPKCQKSNYIRKWLEPKSGKFIIPKECFLDNEPKETSQVVLIDDKVKAFENLPSGVRGYLVLGSSIADTKLQLMKIPPSVKQIMHIDEIIGQEFQI